MATITPRAAEPARPRRESAAPRRSRSVAPVHLGLAAILVLSGLLEFVRLSQNGYANIYYSAAVKSMLRSWHNFFFVAADPNGLDHGRQAAARAVAAGAEREALRLRAAEPADPRGDLRGARGGAALPDRRAAVRRARRAASSALALAVFPSFVAVSRDNGVDPLLILLMLAACGAASGRDRLGSPAARSSGAAVLVGLAFNTKALAALLVRAGDRARLPRLRAGLAARGAWRSWRRPASCSSIVARRGSRVVELTPASQRPFVGSTSSNSELQLDLRLQRLRPRRRPAGRPRDSTQIYLDRGRSAAAGAPGRDTRPADARSSSATSRRHPPAAAGGAGHRAPAPAGRQRARAGPVRRATR